MRDWALIGLQILQRPTKIAQEVLFHMTTYRDEKMFFFQIESGLELQRTPFKHTSVHQDDDAVTATVSSALG
jgi:hypothetical protein